VIAMSVPPECQKLVEEAERRGDSNAWVKHVLFILEYRFGSGARELESQLKLVEDDWRLMLLCSAGEDPSLDLFRSRLS
jgi:hypothetical protein